MLCRADEYLLGEVASFLGIANHEGEATHEPRLMGTKRRLERGCGVT